MIINFLNNSKKNKKNSAVLVLMSDLLHYKISFKAVIKIDYADLYNNLT